MPKDYLILEFLNIILRPLWHFSEETSNERKLTSSIKTANTFIEFFYVCVFFVISMVRIQNFQIDPRIEQ